MFDVNVLKVNLNFEFQEKKLNSTGDLVFVSLFQIDQIY